MSEKRSAKPNKSNLSRMEGVTVSEARSQTALVQQMSNEAISHQSRYNMS